MPKKSKPSLPTEWLYAIGGDIFYMLPIEVVDQQDAELAEAAAWCNCSTWGEIYRLRPDGRDDAADKLGVDVIDLPDDDEPFGWEQYPGVGDSDFPTDPRLLMTDDVPSELVEKFGRCYSTFLCGDFTELDASRADEILAAGAALGMKLSHSERVEALIRI